MPLQLSRTTSVALLSITLLPLSAFQARAGASLLVDDAAATPAGHCQVES